MSPIPIFTSKSIAPPLSAFSRLRGRFPNRLIDRGLHSEEWVPEVFQPEEFKTERLSLLDFLSSSRDLDHLPQPLQSSQFQPEQFVPRQVSGDNTQARGGGGSASSGGSRGPSSSSSGDSTAPVPAPVAIPQPKSPGPSSVWPWGKPVKQPPPSAPKPVPKPAPKLPAQGPSNPKSASPPISQPAPNSGSTPPKPKSGAWPSIVPDVKPKTGNLPKIPKQPKIPGYEPHSQMPHMPAGGSSGGHEKNGDSNKLSGCNIRCRNALLGTFGALAIVGLLGLIIFWFCRRKRSYRRRDTERGRTSRSRSYSDGRRWWKQGQSDSRLSEDGMKLTTHTASGVSFSMLQERPRTPQVHNSERSTSSYNRETPGPSENPQMHSQEQSTGSNGEGESMSIRSDRTSDSIITARSISTCESCVLQRAQMHNHEQSTSSSGARKPMSIESDKSSCEDPTPEIAQCAMIVRRPPVIHTIAGMQAFRAGECELQRRNARRNSDRPDMSESRHQSLNSESSGTFAIGEDSDEAESEDTYTVTDDDDADIATGNEHSRGRTGQRSFHSSARMRETERLEILSLEQVSKHADGRTVGSESGIPKGRGEGSPHSIVAVDFLSPDYRGTTDPRVPRCWRP